MNSRQRRTKRRALDARRPYGAAVERERAKNKRLRAGLRGGAIKWHGFNDANRREFMERVENLRARDVVVIRDGECEIL